MKASQAHGGGVGNELERRELEALVRVLLHQTLDADVRRAEADRLEHRQQLRRPCGEEGERRGERGERGRRGGGAVGAERRRTEAVAQRKVGRAVGEALRDGAELEEGDAADAERRRHAEPLRELAAEGDEEQRDEDDLERREEGDDGRRARLQRERLRAVAEREPEPALEAAHHQLARQLPLSAAEQRRERGGGDGEARGGGGARLEPAADHRLHRREVGAPQQRDAQHQQLPLQPAGVRLGRLRDVGPIGGGGGVIGGEAGVEVLEGRRRLEEALELLLLWCIRRRDAKILERRAELRT